MPAHRTFCRIVYAVQMTVLLIVLVVLLLILLALCVVTAGPAVGAATIAAVVGGASHTDNQLSLADVLDYEFLTAGPQLHQPVADNTFVAPAGGGAPGGAVPGGATPSWWKFKNWGDLSKDKAAEAEYIKARVQAINHPEFDWKPVLDRVLPLLAENREWIGLINVEADGKTLRLDDHEASPTAAKPRRSRTGGDTYASVPSALVAKYRSRPALFIFHTHPDSGDVGDPRPSSVDLTLGILDASAARFAAHVVIGAFGVFMYGLTAAGYNRIHSAKFPTKVLHHHMHDVAAAHEAMRSWAPYTNADYVEFFPRHEMFFYVVPSPRYNGLSSYVTKFRPIIERNMDYDLLTEHRNRALKSKKQP